MSSVLERWNFLPAEGAANEILPCCGSRGWAVGMAARRPLKNEEILLAASDEIWRSLTEEDWLEAFRSHPRIGESGIGESEIAAADKNRAAIWSGQEQRGAADAGDRVKVALAQGNREYERRFNRTFIVCATGKSAAEIFAILRRRMTNDIPAELQEAAEQQRQIIQIRLRKWLQS